MGRYRHANIDQNIKWAKDGEWCVSLGVPMGNELDTSKWWKKRIEAVQAKSERWKGLYRSSYFGRNLIVQAIYFGSLRYWLFSIFMEKEILQIVQRDADQLWWSKEPDLQKPPVRFRRFVAKLTAIGTRSKGGLKNMDWESHTQGFYAQWIVRYVHPSKASWKTLLDDLLLENVKGDQNFPEGRAILFCPMTRRDKLKMLRGLPRNAKYFRKCLDAHWKCGIKQNLEVKDNIGSEFLWRNWRFEIQADHHLRRYVSTTLETFQLSDIINKTTNDLFTLNEWKRWIAYLHEQQLRKRPSQAFVQDIASKMRNVCAQIPNEIINLLKTQTNTPPKVNELVALLEKNKFLDDKVIYAYKKANGNYETAKIDNTGTAYGTGMMRQYPNKEEHKVAFWRHSKKDIRVIGPEEAAFPQMEGWLLNNENIRIDQLSIKTYTKAFTEKKFKPPTETEKKWKEKYPQLTLPMKKVWKIRALGISTRDQITWLKVHHRTLYVLKHDSNTDSKCRACSEEENITHLCDCDVLRDEFWDPVITLLTGLGMPQPQSVSAFIALGILKDDEVIEKNVL